MKWLVCQKQHGVGCDYTIGCGMTYSIWEADTEEDLIEKIIYPDGRNEYCALDGDSAREEILLIPADCIKRVDIDKQKAELNSIKKEREKDAFEEYQRKIYLQLKEKFGE